MADPIKFPRVTTPIGASLFTNVDKPDTKWKPEGEYRARILLNATEHAEFLATLDQMALDSFEHECKTLKPAMKKVSEVASPYAVEFDSEGQETGNVIVSASLRAEYTDKKTGRTYTSVPAVFDSAYPKPNPVEREGLVIGNGSLIRISMDPRSYYMPSSKKGGVSFRLRAIQVIELKSYSGNADSYGFGGIEGGFQSQSQTSGSASASDDDDDDVPF